MNNYNYFYNMENNPYYYADDMRIYQPAVNMAEYGHYDNSPLYSAYEGYMKGNMFKDLYDPYMNYQPAQIKPKNEKEELLLNLNKIQFCAHELALLLDVMPHDTHALNEFNKYSNEYNKLLKEYESKYEILNVNDDQLNKAVYDWSSEKWPWEGGVL